MKILVLLSGGLDSSLVLATCVGQGHSCSAVGFDYGQPHLIELEQAAQIARHYSTPFRVVPLPTMPRVNDVVFAGRNLVLIAQALAIAAAEKFDAVAVGCNESDWMRFPDCRPGFWNAVRTAAEAYGVKVLTPLLHSWKAQIVHEAERIGVPIELTWSCYAPQDGLPCGQCLACETRNAA